MADSIPRSTLLFIGSAIALVVITLGVFASGAWASIVYELLVDGGLLLVWLAAATGIGAVFLRALRITSITSASLWLASACGLGLGVIALAVLGLGLLGGLSFWTAAAIIAVGCLLLLRLLIVHRKTTFAFAAPSPASWLWLILVPLASLTFVAALVPAGILWGDEPNGYDVVEYHLQVPREWYEAGRITPLQHNVFSFFPFNVEMHYLLAMELRGNPWRAMFLAQLMHAAMIALTIIAVYGAVAQTNAKPQAAIIAAMLTAATPWMALLAPIAYNEAGLLLFGTLAIAWSLRALSSSQPLREMALAGAMAGFACGVKLTAVPMLLLAIPIGWIIAQRRLASLKPCAVFVIAALITFSPWLIRNLAWTGNPVFPEMTSLLGSAHFTPTQVQRWTQAHSPRPDQRGVSARLGETFRQILADWRFGYILIPLGVLAAVLTIRRPTTILLLVVLLIQLIVWIGFTHLQSRFFVLAIPPIAILVGLSLERSWQLYLAGFVAAVLGFFALGSVGHSLMEMDRSISSRPNGLPLSSLLGFDGIDRSKQPLLDGISDETTLILIADAQAYLYQRPMKSLRYRTVFDVQTNDDDPIASWAGPGAGRASTPVAVLVDPAELRRLSNTYYGLPRVPDDLPQHPYLMRATEPSK